MAGKLVVLVDLGVLFNSSSVLEKRHTITKITRNFLELDSPGCVKNKDVLHSSRTCKVIGELKDVSSNSKWPKDQDLP